MLELSLIKETVTQVADAITAVLGIDTEIVDSHLKIISGTGRFHKRVGTYEESGNLDSNEYYARMIRSGKEGICLDAGSDRNYNRQEGELSEITCPIMVDGDVVGLIGLIAFTAKQHAVLCERTQALLVYLRKMAELLASKLVESTSNHELAMLINSAPQGIIATHMNGNIISCNEAGEKLLARSEKELEGTDIKGLFPGVSLFSDNRQKSSVNVEVAYGNARLFFNAVVIPGIGRMYFFQDSDMTSELLQSSLMDSAITFDDIYGSSQVLIAAKERAIQIADNDSTVLITGESGTGKELFARAIHNAGERKGKPFVSINCGAIPETLFESELFGYEKGAFTGASATGKIGKFELANHGTVFLDEIGDMPLHLQVKLLKVLQDRELTRVGGTRPVKINIRLIAATNKPLEEMVRNNEFRGDLYYRLSVIPLQLPPLRERKGDLGVILASSLERFNRMMGKSIQGFDQETLEKMMAYPWPGNIREVENTVEYCVNMEKGSSVKAKNLPERILNYRPDSRHAQTDSRGLEGELAGSGTLKEQLETVERRILIAALDESGYDRAGKKEVARKLGIGESSLYRKLKDLRIENR